MYDLPYGFILQPNRVFCLISPFFDAMHDVHSGPEKLSRCACKEAANGNLRDIICHIPHYLLNIAYYIYCIVYYTRRCQCQDVIYNIVQYIYIYNLRHIELLLLNYHATEQGEN